MARKRQLLQEREAARYVPGEGHLYLGRRHRLLLVDGARDEPLRLAHGRFELARRERGRGGEIVSPRLGVGRTACVTRTGGRVLAGTKPSLSDHAVPMLDVLT